MGLQRILTKNRLHPPSQVVVISIQKKMTYFSCTLTSLHYEESKPTAAMYVASQQGNDVTCSRVEVERSVDVVYPVT